MKYLVVVDMQNDFIDGSLGTKEAVAIVPNVVKKIQEFDGAIIFTRDTHHDNYLETQEGKKLPVKHCIDGTHGWEISSDIKEIPKYADGIIFDKPTFGSRKLAKYLKKQENVESVEVIGLCTDICVISNALMIKAFLPEVPVSVDASCCAGVTPESHENALNAMKMCQIDC